MKLPTRCRPSVFRLWSSTDGTTTSFRRRKASVWRPRFRERNWRLSKEQLTPPILPMLKSSTKRSFVSSTNRGLRSPPIPPTPAQDRPEGPTATPGTIDKGDSREPAQDHRRKCLSHRFAEQSPTESIRPRDARRVRQHVRDRREHRRARRYGSIGNTVFQFWRRHSSLAGDEP